MENAKKNYIIAWVQNETDIHTLATLIELVARRIDNIEKQNIIGAKEAELWRYSKFLR